ncbi:MAG TPA: hypothetical protein VLN61_00525 [Pseudolabrys sp.]|nr:hypothetical protein [Pseudolabrys sp.]
MLQVVGSLLAIPVGLASGYSIYRANFSVETTCQSLRGSIVSMIDKSVDAGTRRMLVRRDVERFEQTCGATDPDATAAFKALLAADKPAAPVTAPVARRPDAAPKESVRKADPPAQVTAKLPAAASPPAATEPVRHDAAVSDAQWLDAVRQALLVHGADPPTVGAAKAPVVHATVPAQRPAQQVATLPPQAPVVAAPALVISPVAPALPPAVSIATPAAPQADADHPVPPGAIPESTSPTDAAKPEEQGHPRVRRWIAKIPLMGNVINNGW